MNVLSVFGDTTVLLVNNNPELPTALNQLCTVTKESEGAGATGAEEHSSHGTCFCSLVLSIKSFFKETFAHHGGQSHTFNVLT